MPDASPAKWHLAHTSWFFETFVLRDHVAGYRPFDPRFAYLFNSYYEAVGERHPRAARGHVTRPGVAEVAAYRQDVEEQLVARLEDGTLDEALLDLVELGCHHEEQHQELLLMDVKHLLSGNVLQPVYVERAPDPDPAADPLPQRWTHVPGGVTHIGDDGSGFAFDNERPRHRVWLDDVEVGTRQVTNAEWVRFIDDGGYARPDLWLSDGWATLQATGWDAPGYWRRDDDHGWTTFTLSGRRPVVAAEPVCHISFFEADAFARWAGHRLPTEQEWEAMETPFRRQGAKDPLISELREVLYAGPAWIGKARDGGGIAADRLQEIIDAARSRWSRHGSKGFAKRALRTASRGQLFTEPYPKGSRVADCIIAQQGPNYAVAKRLQRWRAVASEAA